MRFEELKIVTNDKWFVIEFIEKRLIEKNVSYVKLNYDGYTEFHFQNNIYSFVFVDHEYGTFGKYDVVNRVINSINENDFAINDMRVEPVLETKEKSGYKRYTKNDYKNNNQKVNVKSKCKSIFNRRG